MNPSQSSRSTRQGYGAVSHLFDTQLDSQLKNHSTLLLPGHTMIELKHTHTHTNKNTHTCKHKHTLPPFKYIYTHAVSQNTHTLMKHTNAHRLSKHACICAHPHTQNTHPHTKHTGCSEGTSSKTYMFYKNQTFVLSGSSI